jgi:hypothetical protein
MAADSNNLIIFRSIITKEVWEPYGRYFNMFFDMVYLRSLVWPIIRDRSNIYDSYHCKNTEELGVSQPWPTQRQGQLYVGAGPTKYNVTVRLANHTCPRNCRPKDHKDWQFC